VGGAVTTGNIQRKDCPLADRAVVGSNVQKRGGHMSVGVTFKGRTGMSIGRRGCQEREREIEYPRLIVVSQ
jgi:hypothetical protein